MQAWECVNDLKSKLYTEVQNYEILERSVTDLETKKYLLNEIINILESSNSKPNFIQVGLLLTNVYEETEVYSIYDKLVSISYSDDDKMMKLIKSKLKDDFQSFSDRIKLLTNQLPMKKPTAIEYRRILSNFKYSGLITPLQVELITKVMQQYKYDEKDQIRILESIRIHNIKVKYEDKSKISYTVVNMLDEKYEKLDIDEIDEPKYKTRFQSMVDSFFKSIRMIDSIEDVITLMPDLDSGNYNLEEFDYIYKSVINLLIDDLLESINSISDSEIYKDIELRKVVIQEYNERKYKYGKLLNDYNTKRQAYISQLEMEKELKTEMNNITSTFEVVNNLFYKMTSNGETSYLERDIKDFPEEYLLTVKMLIDGKKSDKLTILMDKSFLSIHKQMKEYRELRSDQVRIIYKHISDNNYLIMGAFVKKSDNDRKMYGNIVARNSNIDISKPENLQTELENSRSVEERLFSYINEHSRKDIW